MERHNPSGAGRTSHFLSARELKTVEAFAEVFIDAPDAVLTPREIVRNIDRHLGRIESNRTRSLKLLLFLIEYVLPRRSLWPFRPPFSKMNLKDRKRFIERVLQEENGRVEKAAKRLGIPRSSLYQKIKKHQITSSKV